MSIVKPPWFDYVEWDYSDIDYPVMKGLRKDTPKELVEQFERDQKEFARMRKEHIDF